MEIGAEETGAYVYSEPPLSAEDEYLLEPEDAPDLTDLPALDCLTPKQRFVIECRSGLRMNECGEYEALTLEEIGALMGVSRQAVERIESRARNALRRALDI